jgi:uncharacterized protein (DUF58 family)
VPRIARVSRFDLPARLRHQQGGVAFASHTGESTELAGLRAWRDGDRIRDLHARSWARFGEPVVREYQQEYFSRVAVVLDTDAAEASERSFEASLSIAAGVVEHLMRGEALIDLLATGDPAGPVTLGRSLGGLDQALDRLAALRPTGSFDPDEAFAALCGRLQRLSAVVFVTLAWNLERSRFVERIEKAGAGVRVIGVSEATTAFGVSDPRIRVIEIDRIEAAIRSAPVLVL